MKKPENEQEPTTGHNRFVTDYAVTIDDSEAVGEYFDTSDFDHLFTPEELAVIKKKQGRE